MELQSEERKLTTILFADVVGYSRLMGENEAGTLAAIKAHSNELIEPKATQYHGRTVKLIGDGALMEFPSVVDALRFAVEVQCAMGQRNRDVPEDRQIVYRIGINIGDIIIDGEDIYGDGVNIASRIEALAEPGGICIARNVYNQIGNKLDLGFEHLGEKTVKNIAKSVSVYGVAMDERALALVTPVVMTTAWSWHQPAIAAGIVLLLAFAGGALWLQPWKPNIESASVERMTFPLPDKPSIAVLAFDNMSDDKSQEYFADGMTEDIITDLSKISGLFVIARKSSFAYKRKKADDVRHRLLAQAKQADVRTIARALGVKYVLEGSVRRAGGRVRINAQLINGMTGGHLWAQRYDRSLKDVFEVQDEITQKIVTALEVELTEFERKRVASRYTNNVAAYDAYLLAKSYRGDLTKEKNEHAQRLLERAIGLDPNFAAAYAELAYVWQNAWFAQWNKGTAKRIDLQPALETARKAVALDDTLPEAHARLAWTYLWLGTHEQAIVAARRAIALDPNYADGYLLLSHILIYAGQPEKGIRIARKGMPLDPASMFHSLMHLADGQWMLGQHDEAIVNLERSVALRPEFMRGYLWLAAINGYLGRKEAAKVAAEKVLQLSPQVSIAGFRHRLPYKDQYVIERFLDGLRKSGLPE